MVTVADDHPAQVLDERLAPKCGAQINAVSVEHKTGIEEPTRFGEGSRCSSVEEPRAGTERLARKQEQNDASGQHFARLLGIRRDAAGISENDGLRCAEIRDANRASSGDELTSVAERRDLDVVAQGVGAQREPAECGTAREVERWFRCPCRRSAMCSDTRYPKYAK